MLMCRGARKHVMENPVNVDESINNLELPGHAPLSLHSSAMSLAKIPGIIVAAVGFHMACTPPLGASRTQERISPTMLEKCLINPPARAVLKMWYAAIAECIVIIASRIPHHPIAQHLLRVAHFQGGVPQTLAASPTFLAGAALIVSGACIRDRCYKTLGTLFTFERTIRPGHRLVTSGPYSIVRHPSYAALIPIYFGIGLWHTDRNSWLRQSSVLDASVGRILVGSIVTSFILASIPLLGRPPKEDATLKEEFGEQWERWAKQVPYALIPGIY
ncbi:hypothetical protein BD779DRAFT_1137994 [Infundibulicybe gibba]|nr:hypothetical protein BD779DRAFT_1137994 [Infundibulicybe gibba]